jgi:hypothetical protein
LSIPRAAPDRALLSASLIRLGHDCNRTIIPECRE